MSSQLTSNVWHLFDITAGDDGVTSGDSTCACTVVSKGNGMCPSKQHLEIGFASMHKEKCQSMSRFSHIDTVDVCYDTKVTLAHV